MLSNTRKTTLTENIRAWSTAIVVCLALMLGFASTGYGDVILGNFESADSNDGWGGGSNDANAILVPDSNIGVTLGHGSLKFTPVSGGYFGLGWAASKPSEILNFADANIQFDLTMVASEWGGSTWIQVGDKIAINSNGPSGWKEYGPTSSSLLAYSIINRDTGEPTSRDWGPWAGDANKTYSYDISDYDATGATWMQINISVQDGNLLDTGHFYFDNIRLVTPNMVISKCTVTAGKTQASSGTDYSNMKDAFKASGTVALPDEINDFNNTIRDINAVTVTITSATDDNPYTETIPFDAAAVHSKHKYTYTGKLVKGQEGKITSMTLDFRKGTFAITAKNIDLTGLASPIELKFALGSNELIGHANELIINGPTKTIPTRLMRLYEDTLIVTPGKTKVTNSAKASSDKLSVTGEIATVDIPNLHNIPVVITWGDKNDANDVQTFTIPINSFKIPTTGHLFRLNKNITPTVTPDAEPNAKVSGTIDLDKCTFALSITKADINNVSGETKFGIVLGDFNEVDDVNLAWKK